MILFNITVIILLNITVMILLNITVVILLNITVMILFNITVMILLNINVPLVIIFIFFINQINEFYAQIQYIGDSFQVTGGYFGEAFTTLAATLNFR